MHKNKRFPPIGSKSKMKIYFEKSIIIKIFIHNYFQGSKEVLRVEASLEEGRKQRQDIITLTGNIINHNIIKFFSCIYACNNHLDSLED